MARIDISDYEGREQAYVKHSLLEVYLPELAYRVGKKWDSLAYVDGFAGPWKTQDTAHSDSSFGIAIDALRRSQKGLRDAHERDLHVDAFLSKRTSRRKPSPSKDDRVVVLDSKALNQL